MALVGWISTATGLPSLYATGNGDLTADGAPFDRLIASVDGGALVSDPGAPVGQPTTYRFGSASVTLTRAGQAAAGPRVMNWVTTSDGLTVADVRVTGSDERTHETDAEVFTSALGRQIPRYRLGQQPAQGTLEVATVGAGTAVLRELVSARAPLWVIHDLKLCQVPGCDIEGARLIVPHRMSESRSRRRDVAQRDWTVSYSRVPDSLASLAERRADGVPAVTWGQWEAWAKQYSPKGWQDWSEIQVAQRVTGMPQI